MSLSQTANRFKQVREELGYTQSAFAKILGIKSTTADIERSKVKITGSIVKDLLSKFSINPLWLYGESKQQYLNISSQNVAPRVITVDSQGAENILMVNAKAAAGYPGSIDDQQFYNDLPAFSFPLAEYRNTSFRGFQVEGDRKIRKLDTDLQLISINSSYSQVEIPKTDVKEVWEFYSKISREIDEQVNSDLLKDIKSDLEEIKGKL